MTLPTLLQKNTLISHMGESMDYIENNSSLTIIMNWFDRKVNILPQSMSDRAIVLKSGTGSAKSTAIAPTLFARYNTINKNNKKPFTKVSNKTIVITQPRVLTAIEIPKTIASIDAYKKMGIALYENLGYQTKEFVRKPMKRGILFTTVGTLLQHLKNMSDEQFIKRYGIILIDEVHDRTLDIDLILQLLKSLVQRNLNKECPFVIVMSATIDTKLYADYFDTKTIFEVSGKSYGIVEHYEDYDVSNYLTRIEEIVTKITTNTTETYITKKQQYNFMFDMF